MSIPTSRAAEAVARFDVDDPAFLADPYPVLNELREATPIFRNERTNQWVLTRFEDVAETLRDRRLGRALPPVRVADDAGGAPPAGRWASFEQHERWSLLSLEPPDHTRIRRLLSKVFTPRAITALRPAIEALANELLDECKERETFDLLANYAQPFSVAVICSLLGVPRADTQLLLDWSHAIVKMYELSTTDAVRVAAEKAAGEYIAHTRALIAEKRSRPDGLLVSELARVEEGGERLTEDEIVSTTMVLVEAGHEATVNTLGNGMWAMLRHPAEWQRVVRGEVPARVAIEEMLRWDAPLQLFERWVLEDGVEIANQPIPKGEEVAMLFGAAQRDPRRFAEPDRFDVGRNDPAHIGFGGGIHFCIGAPLARQELDVSLAGIARRFPDVSIVEKPTFHKTFVIRGLTGLHLRT